MVALADRQIARRVELLAIPLVRQHVDAPVLYIRAGHAAGTGFAGIQAALAVERVAARPVGRIAKADRFRARTPFPDLVGHGIAEYQEALFGPGRTFGEDKVPANDFDGNFGEILSGRE